MADKNPSDGNGGTALAAPSSIGDVSEFTKMLAKRTEDKVADAKKPATEENALAGDDGLKSDQSEDVKAFSDDGESDPLTEAKHGGAEAEPEPDQKSSNGSGTDGDKKSKKAAKTTEEKLSTLDKKFRELQSQTDKVRAQNLALEETNKVNQTKLDGTYVAPPEPSEAAKKASEEAESRERASRPLVEVQFGKEFVQKQIYDDNSPWQKLTAQNPSLKARVFYAENPVSEALAVLKEEEVLDTYGRDTKKVVEKVEAEIRPRLLKEFKDSLAGKSEKNNEPDAGLSGVRSSSERSSDQSKPAKKEFSVVGLNPHNDA